ncbi:hypothetical protein [Streptomyces coeruleorubidus]|uniref:Uncharacterized protein n=1 Tax=Streptomyces coeruleorubidus TaxID=116188 RepID=A0A5J6HVH4_STRC4|nr:hypothetical protein [Streptomyces coeruleorubidus]QEV22774.1 hypothetical protein CP976_00165 [Streptomyces coeruleorubidus]GGU02850.1 hypothetical protein GCM10010256_73660 [Streptomyces coeruleorubidus]
MRELLRDEAGLTELAPGTRCHGMDGMSGDRRALRLLERACAVIAVLYATLLAFFTNYDALLITYQNGDLTPTIAIFAGARVGWLGLRLMRSGDRQFVSLDLDLLKLLGQLIGEGVQFAPASGDPLPVLHPGSSRGLVACRPADGS